MHTIPATHPCLSGHFPDQPVVPAVILLEMLQNTIAEHHPDAVIDKISRAKFSGVLKADTAVRVLLRLADSQARFVMQTKLGIEISRGQFTYRLSCGGSEHE